MFKCACSAHIVINVMSCMLSLVYFVYFILSFISSLLNCIYSVQTGIHCCSKKALICMMQFPEIPFTIISNFKHRFLSKTMNLSIANQGGDLVPLPLLKLVKRWPPCHAASFASHCPPPPDKFLDPLLFI